MNSEEIFDWVMSEEDKYLEQVKQQVIDSAENKFGIEGKNIAHKYYRTIDGYDPDGENEDDVICDDCKENAKKLSQNMSILHDVGRILSMDSMDVACKNIDYSDAIKFLNDAINVIDNQSCFNHDKNDLKLFILLNIYKQSKDTEEV